MVGQKNGDAQRDREMGRCRGTEIESQREPDRDRDSKRQGKTEKEREKRSEIYTERETYKSPLRNTQREAHTSMNTETQTQKRHTQAQGLCKISSDKNDRVPCRPASIVPGRAGSG